MSRSTGRTFCQVRYSVVNHTDVVLSNSNRQQTRGGRAWIFKVYARREEKVKRQRRPKLGVSPRKCLNFGSRKWDFQRFPRYIFSQWIRKKSALVSCWFYPSLFKRDQWHHQNNSIIKQQRKYWHKHTNIVRKMYQSSSRFNDKNTLFQEIRSIVFPHISAYAYMDATLLQTVVVNWKAK